MTSQTPIGATEESKAALFLLVGLGLFIIWWPEFPPLIDLPQHASQIAWMLRLEEPDGVPYQELFRINLLTPYLFGDGIAYLLAHVISIGSALKLCLSFYLLGFIFGPSGPPARSRQHPCVGALRHPRRA